MKNYIKSVKYAFCAVFVFGALVCSALWASMVVIDLQDDPPQVILGNEFVACINRDAQSITLEILDNSCDLGVIFLGLDESTPIQYALYSSGIPVSAGEGTLLPLSSCSIADEVVFFSDDPTVNWDVVSEIKTRRFDGDAATKEVFSQFEDEYIRQIGSRNSFVLKSAALAVSDLEESQEDVKATDDGFHVLSLGCETGDCWGGVDCGPTNLTVLTGFYGSYPSGTNGFSTSISNALVWLETDEEYVFRVGADDEADLEIGGLGKSVIEGEHALRWGNTVTGSVAVAALYPLTLNYRNVGGPYDLRFEGIPSPLYSGERVIPYAELSPTNAVISLSRKNPELANGKYTIGIQSAHEEVNYTVVKLEGPGDVCCKDNVWTYNVSISNIGPVSTTNAVLGLKQQLQGIEGLKESKCVIRIEVDSSNKAAIPNACGCETTSGGSQQDANCIAFTQRFGMTPWASAAPFGYLRIEVEDADRAITTPAILRYDHPIERRLRGNAQGIAVVEPPLGHKMLYCDGQPTSQSATLDSRLIPMSATEPNRVREVFSDRSEVIYEDGEAIAIVTSDGVYIPREELGIEVVRDDRGYIRQIWSSADGLLDVVTISPSRFRVNWYSPSSVGVKDPSTERYSTSGEPAKYFDFGTPSGGVAGESFSLVEYRSSDVQFHTRWDWSEESHDWSMVKGLGDERMSVTRETAFNGDGTFTVTKRKSSSAGTASEEITIYSVQDGIAPISVSKGGRETQSTTRKTEGNGLGRPQSTVNSRGLIRTNEYDTEGRIVREVEENGVLNRSRAYAYPSGSETVDFTPSLIETRVNDILVRTETNERVGTRESGLVERSTTRVGDVTHTRLIVHYPSISENRFAAGRTALRVSEDGRAVTNEYCATEGALYVHTATDGVYDENGFRTIDGKSSRTHRTYNSRGDVIRESKDVLVDGAWREVEWTTHTYSLIHQRLGSVRSNGLTSSSSKICTGSLWEVDENGVLTTNVFDSTKRIVRSERHGPFGVTAEDYTLDAEGRKIAVVRSSEGMATQREETTYDLEGRVASHAGVDGATTRYSYSSDGLVDTIIYADGGTRITTRNCDGSLASITGTAVTPEYHTYGVTDEGLEWECVRYGRADSPRFEKTYRNGFGETVRVERSGYNGAMLVTENTYNEKGQLVQTAETGKPTVSYTYNDWGELVSTTQTSEGVSRTTQSNRSYALIDGEVWQTSTQKLSTSDSTIAPLTSASHSRVSGLSLERIAESFTVDERGNTNRTWSAVNPSAAKRMSWSTRAGVGNVAFSESIDGAMTRSVNTSAITNTVQYDAFKRQVATTDGRGNTTSYVYDELGRMSRQIDPCGNETAYVYDAMGRISEVTNALGNVTFTRYDLRGNKTYEGGATYPVSYTYDEFGNRTSMTTYRNESSSEGDTTSWIYDEATGLVTQKLYADGHGPYYTYTDDGKLATRTWARGIVTDYGYDTWGNLTSTTYSDGTPSVTLSYDALGRLKTANDAAGTTTYTYDAFGDEAQIATSGLYSKTLVRHRDTFGRDLGHSMDSSRKNVIEYEEETGRVKRTMLGGAWYTWDYLQGTDLKSSLSVGTAATTTWSYEPQRDLLTQVKNEAFGSIISQYDYTNDALGRRTAIARSGTMMSESRSDAYGYNTRSELISAAKNGVDEYAYQYDDIGNRESSVEPDNSSIYTANELNQYTDISTVHLHLDSSPSFAPQYDLDGNQTLVKTKTGIWSVTYNGENRPVSWSCGTTNIVMKFDRMGRRVEYIETVRDDETGSVVTNKHHKFVYDGYLCIQRLNGANNAVTDLFEWDPTEPVATRPLFWQPRTAEGNYSLFYTHDGNKNVSEVVFYQRARGVAAHYEYAPFGEVTVQTRGTAWGSLDLSTLNPWRFSSEYSDQILSLVSYNYRNFDSLYGKWLQRDIIGESIDRCLYGFISNNPVASIDVLGLERLVFDSEKICLQDDAGTRCIRCWEAVSGRVDGEKFNYSKERQKIKDLGPIPEGLYTLPTMRVCDPSVVGNWNLEDWNEYASHRIWNMMPWRTRIDPRNKTSWGLRFGRMIPQKGTNTYGRSSFNIHGGDKKGSAGCIDVGSNDVDLFDKVRGLSQASVIVVVDYTGKKNSICCCAQILPAKWR